MSPRRTVVASRRSHVGVDTTPGAPEIVCPFACPTAIAIAASSAAAHTRMRFRMRGKRYFMPHDSCFQCHASRRTPYASRHTPRRLAGAARLATFGKSGRAAWPAGGRGGGAPMPCRSPPLRGGRRPLRYTAFRYAAHPTRARRRHPRDHAGARQGQRPGRPDGRELQQAFNHAASDPHTRGVVLTSALPRMFSAGFDVERGVRLRTRSHARVPRAASFASSTRCVTCPSRSSPR